MMAEVLDELQATIADGLKNRTLTTCSRWANRRRIMGGDFAGPYSDNTIRGSARCTIHGHRSIGP